MDTYTVSCAHCGQKVASDAATRGVGYWYCSPEHKAKWIADRRP